MEQHQVQHSPVMLSRSYRVKLKIIQSIKEKEILFHYQLHGRPLRRRPLPRVIASYPRGLLQSQNMLLLRSIQVQRGHICMVK
jgi:hypothetical protein